MFIDTLFIPYTILTTVLIIAVIVNLRSDQTPFNKIIAGCLICLPIVYFFTFLSIHIVDVPFSDDYNLLDSFIRMTGATTFEGRIQALFEQVNQHRFAFERSVMYLLYLISGDFSVKTHILIGNLALIGIVYLLYQHFKNTHLPLSYFIPVPLLIFSLLFYENATWSIAALQNTPILFFAMLTSYLLGKSRFTLALLTAIVTTFISGNGVSIWIVGIILLFFQEKYSRMITWLVIAGLIVSFYFTYDYHYYKSAGVSLLSFPVQNFLLVNAFWGNIFYGDFSHIDTRTLYPDILASVLTGISLLILTLILLFKTVIEFKYNRQPANWMLIGTMLFVLATGSMLVISRPTDWNILHGGDVFSRRYMIFGTTLFVCGYLVFIDLIKTNKPVRTIIFICMSLFAGVAHLGSYYFFAPKVITTQEELSLDSFYIQNHGTLLSIGETYGEKPFWNHPHTFLNLLKTASQKDLFEHPAPTVHNELLNKEAQVDQAFINLKLKSKISKTVKNLGGTSKTINLMLEYNPEIEADVKYFIFRSSSHELIVPAVLRNIPVEHPKDLFKKSYSYTFREEKFPAGTYEVYVAAEKQDTLDVYKLNKSIVLQDMQD